MTKVRVRMPPPPNRLRNEEREEQIKKSNKQPRATRRADDVIPQDRWWKSQIGGDVESDETAEYKEIEDINNHRSKKAAAAAAASSSSSSSSSSPAVLKKLHLNSSIDSYIHEFITAALSGKKLNPDKNIKPKAKKKSILRGREVEGGSNQERYEAKERQRRAKSNQSTFLGKLLHAFDTLDQKDKLTDDMWRPYLNALRSLIRRASPTEELYYYEGIPCTLLEFILWTWSINNRDHFAYECLIAALSSPEVTINRRILLSWLEDSATRTDLVFYALMQYGKLTLEKWNELIKMDDLRPNYLVSVLIYESTRSNNTGRLMSLLSHDYALMMYDLVFDAKNFGLPADSSSSFSTSSNKTMFEDNHLSMQSFPSSSTNSIAVGPVQLTATYLFPGKSDWQKRVTDAFIAHWLHEVRPYLLREICASTPLILDCANLCLQYIDGSDEVTRSTNSMTELNAMHTFTVASVTSPVINGQNNANMNDITLTKEIDFELPSSWATFSRATAASSSSSTAAAAATSSSLSTTSSRSRTASGKNRKQSAAAKRPRAKLKQQTSSSDEMEDEDEDENENEKGCDNNENESDIEEKSRSRKKRKVKV